MLTPARSTAGSATAAGAVVAKLSDVETRVGDVETRVGDVETRVGGIATGDVELDGVDSGADNNAGVDGGGTAAGVETCIADPDGDCGIGGAELDGSEAVASDRVGTGSVVPLSAVPDDAMFDVPVFDDAVFDDAAVLDTAVDRAKGDAAVVGGAVADVQPAAVTTSTAQPIVTHRRPRIDTPAMVTTVGRRRAR